MMSYDYSSYSYAWGMQYSPASNLRSPDLLVLLTQGDVRSDLKIQFPGTDKTISGHKLVLSLKSPVFFEQFYGPLSAHARADEDFSGRIEVINENQFQFEAFNIFIRHIYGDWRVVHNCTSLNVQLELVQISKFYLTKELENHVIIKVNNFKVTMETILTALEAVLAYKSLDGFEGICSVLNLKVVQTFARLSCMQQSKFYKEQRDGYSLEVDALFELLAESTPEPKQIRIICSVCKEPQGQCVHTADRKIQILNLSANEMILEKNISLFALLPCKDQHMFYLQQKQESPGAVNALIDSLSEYKPKPTLGLICANCLMPAANCKDGKNCDQDPRVGQRIWLGDVAVIEAIRDANQFDSYRDEYDSEDEYGDEYDDEEIVDALVVSFKYVASGRRKEVLVSEGRWSCGDFSYYCRM